MDPNAQGSVEDTWGIARQVDSNRETGLRLQEWMVRILHKDHVFGNMIYCIRHGHSCLPFSLLLEYDSKCYCISYISYLNNI